MRKFDLTLRLFLSLSLVGSLSLGLLALEGTPQQKSFTESFAPKGAIGMAGAMVWRVTHVGKGSPAERAGLQVNDLIIKVNGKQVVQWDDVQYTILNSPSGTTFDSTFAVRTYNPFISRG